MKVNLDLAHKTMGGKIIAKWKEPNDEKSTSLGRAAMIADYMFGKRWLDLKPVMFTPKSTKEKPVPSTALEHFLKFKDNEKAGAFVKILEEYKDCAKTLSTYIDGFLACLRYDNRFHATFFMHRGQEGKEDDSGTVTGRLSIKSPALQTIPKKTKWSKILRRAFIAPKGYVLFSGDFSQGELRIAADFANEKNMLKAYNNNIDLHAFTGAGLADIDFETFMSYKDNEDPYKAKIFETNRQSAKPANFGLLYGMGAQGYKDYAESNYGVKMTLTEAEGQRDKFFATYPGLLPWHKKVKDAAQLMGYVDSPLGRRRHLPLINSRDNQTSSGELRKAVNSPVQSTLSDFSLWATAIAEKEGLTKEAPVVVMIHDQLVAYLPEDNWRFFAKRYRDIMENLPFDQFDWNPKVKFVVDVEISFGDKERGIPPNLAQLTKPSKIDPNWDK
jgi:DNA polymerase I-like protein with 3'-5' exonuclease and polymerase domains